MAFHRRISLLSKPNFSKKFANGSCYLCYVCPESCYQPPPLQSSPTPEISYSTKTRIPTVLILMLCVLGVAFLVLSYLTIYKYRNSRRRNPTPMPETLTANFTDENQGPILEHPIWFIRTVGLPQSVIDSIASFTYRKADGLIDGNDCSVCLNDFRENETLRLLPKCSHAFHLDCIDTWLRSHKNCPLCRAPVLADGGARVESSPSSSGSESRVEIGREDDAVIVQVDGVSGEASRMEKLRVESFDRDLQLQRVRRSVSMDLSCAYEVGDEGCSDHTRLKAVDHEKQNWSNSCGVKRSLSFSGKRKNSNR